VNKIFVLMATLIAAMGLLPMKAMAQKSNQELTGIWQGALDVNTIKLRLVFEVKRNGTSYSATMKSLDQGGQSIPCSEVTLKDSQAHFGVEIIQGGFDGKVSADGMTIKGVWKQGPGTLPLVLTRVARAPVIRRPQEPKPPYPYRAEEVSYPSVQAGVHLAGTLTIPEGNGPFPAVLLITGSGQQNRDEEILGHRPFLVIADYLTRRGVAVLRVDDRGVGKSTGEIASATSADFAQDVRGGITYLKTRKEINSSKIGLAGHSEGGLIAPMVAADSNDIAFLVLLAGPGVPGSEILPEQSALISKASGIPDQAIAANRDFMTSAFTIIKSESDNAKAKALLNTLIQEKIASLPEAERTQAEKQRDSIQAELTTMTSPWMRYFLTYDPRPTLKKVSCPILAMNGAKDLQVPPRQNLPEIEKALKEGRNTRVTIKELPDLNHLFQTTKTGSPSEYNTIEETFSPLALKTMGDWILTVVK